MAIKKIKLPDNTEQEINDARDVPIINSDRYIDSTSTNNPIRGVVTSVGYCAFPGGADGETEVVTLAYTGELVFKPGTGPNSVRNSILTTSQSQASGEGGVSILGTSTGDYAVSAGNLCVANGKSSYAEGYNTETGGDATSNTKTIGDATPRGSYAHAEGNATIAQGRNSHAEGLQTFAAGASSHAEGQHTKANAVASHVEGAYTYTNQQTAHAEGYNTVANGAGSHAEGGNQVYSFPCTASAGSTTITGSFTQSDIAPYTSTQFANVIKAGYVYHESNTSFRVRIMNFTLTSSGSNYNYTMTTETALSTSALSGNIKVVWQYAYGNYSHSEGGGTVAYGSRSHAEGYGTCAFGNCSHTEGQQTYTSNAAEHAEGNYNLSTANTTLHSVGIGTYSARKNAHEITLDGKHYILGVGGYDGTNVTTSGVQDLATVINSGSSGLVIHEVSDSGSTTAGTWKATASGVTALTDGLTIRYKLVVAGAATTTLNLNNLGAKTVYRFNSTKLTTHYAVGSYIILTYNSSLNSGCWITVDGYDSNSDTHVRQYVANDNNEYPLLSRYATTTVTSYQDNYTRFADGVTVNPSTDTVTAAGFKVTGGTSSQVLTADGSTRSITISSSEPTSGTGSDGDIWIVI